MYKHFFPHKFHDMKSSNSLYPTSVSNYNRHHKQKHKFLMNSMNACFNSFLEKKKKENLFYPKAKREKITNHRELYHFSLCTCTILV